MWADNETQIDLLGFSVHSALIQSIITQNSLLPVTVGVFGDWGSGKSSIMKMLQESLESEDKIACIHFNGWQFEGYDDAKSALIHSILLELGEHQRLSSEVKEKVARLLRKINWLRLFSVGYQTVVAPIITAQLASSSGSTPVILSPPVAQPTSDPPDLSNLDLVELVKQDPANQGIIGAREFRAEFEDLIAETNLNSLVILIDDLDRCEPRRLVETLEAIKLFLSVKNVAFVIGADQRIVRYAIAKRYETERIEESERRFDGRLDLVNDYLEKLIQIPYYLPRLSASEIETYISLLFCQLRMGEDFVYVHRAFLESRKDDITSVFRYEDIVRAVESCDVHLPPELESELAWCSMISVTLSDLLKGNPRQTKRLLNALLLRKRLAAAARIDLSDQILVKLMILEYLQPELFAQVYEWQSGQEGMPIELEALEIGLQDNTPELNQIIEEICHTQPEWESTAMQLWFRMPPSLAGQDLRDYFWITRDRITGILSGVAAIPLHIRRLLTDLLDTGDGNILPETNLQISELTADEKLALFNELTAYARREPNNVNVVGIWIRVAMLLPAQISRLLATLYQMSPGSLNSTVPLRLVRIAQEMPAYEEQIRQMFQEWSETHSILGRAAEEALTAMEKRG